VQSTKHVVDAAREAGVKRYVHMSALGTREGAPSRYHQTKWAAEQHVRQSGLAWTILRPSLIYGPGDISINTLAETIRRAPFAPVLGDGHCNIQPVSVEVVARCFVAALHTDGAVGQTVDLCGPEAVTWNELMDLIMARIGVTRPKLHLPLPVARAVGVVLARLSAKPPFNREQAIMAAEDNVGDPLPAERMFGVTQESLETALARYLC
jgi:NADH dehydrogenase